MTKTVVQTTDTLTMCQWAVRSRNQAITNAGESVMSYVVLKLRDFRFELPSELEGFYATIKDYFERKHLGVFEIDMEEEDDTTNDTGTDGNDIA